MHTPQCTLGGSLDPATLGSLQKLRAALQEIPRKLLHRGEQEPDDAQLYGTITGECNYHFTFKVEGGSGFFQFGAGMLVASAERFTGGLPIPLKCKWKRRVHDLTVDIPGVTTNMYQISADDIGTHIIVEASPADSDDGLFGAVVGELGPFELDPMTRRSLDNALGRGSIFFAVATSKPLDDQGQVPDKKDHHIHVSSENIRVVPLDEQGAERSHREVIVEYTAEYPRVIIHTLDTVRFQLSVSESKSFTMVAESRAVRDLIALTIRCFHANRFVPLQTVVEAVLPPQSQLQTGSLDNRLDMSIMVERLVMELNKNMVNKEVADKVLRNTKAEKKQLQEQLMESISGCTDVIVGLQIQFADGSPSSTLQQDPGELREQVAQLEAQNEALRREIAEQAQKREELKRARMESEAAKPLLQQHLEEREMLRSRLSQLSSKESTAMRQDQADQSHALELKRLRQDVEKLHNQKEMLRNGLMDKENEKQELQDNFFYVKGQLDKWQMRVAQDADGDGASKELERHNTTISNAMEERTRFAMRLESCLRDQEKEKVYHEQQIERLMQANARLLEEKDKAQRDVHRLSKMYAESVTELQSESANQPGQDVFNTDPADASTLGGSAPAEPEEVARIREQLQQREEAIRAKEAENESLRTRIRKLAKE